MSEKLCEVHELGRFDFERAWQLQRSLAEEIADGARPPSLLLVEHPPTFTFGRRGQAQHLLWDETECARRGISIHWIDRGGDVTFHGPGQLVGYPLLPLAPGGIGMHTDPKNGRPRVPQADYVGYLRRLEEVLITTLRRSGIAATRLPGLTGVWTRQKRARPGTDSPSGHRRPPAKIAAIGVKVDARGVSQHGFALNVAPDMSFWEGIIGCGLEGFPVTSMAETLGQAPDMARVQQDVVDAFGQVFDLQTLLIKREGPGLGAATPPPTQNSHGQSI